MSDVDFPEIPGPAPDRPIRVTRAQEGMLSAEALLAGKASPFHVLTSAAITGALDPARLRAVLARVTRRNAALRTVFTRDAATGALGSRILADWQPALVEQELPPQRPGTDPVALVHRLLTPAAPQLLRPFEQPPVVFVLTRTGPDRAVLSVLAHHAVLDGWSFGLLWDQITSGYTAGDLPEQDEPAPGMEILVRAEQQGLGDDLVDERATMLAHWPAVAELPGDLERPAARTFAGIRLPFALGEEAAAGAVALGRSVGVSRNVVLLAAWALVVARRAALGKLIVGVPTVGRTAGPGMRVIGGATGLGPVACEVPEQGSVAEYIRGTGKAVREALRYGNVPFEDLVAALAPGADQSRSPLVQIAFGAHNELVPAGLPTDDVQFDVRVGHTGGTAYDAMLHVMRWDPVPELELEYTTSVLTPAEAMDLVASFDRALVELAADPAGPLAEVTTVGAAQLARLEAWQDGPATDSSGGLWQLIEESARRTPDAVAVRDADPSLTLTYRQLMAAVEAQSARLAAAGVALGDRVAVAASRSAAEIIAVLATLRLGAAYVGIDTDSPAAATTAVLDRAGVQVVLGQPDRLAALGTAGDGRIAMPVVDAHALPATAGPAPQPAPADPGRTAYLAFTSGTTGVPKGAMVPCRGVVRLARDPQFLLPGACDRFVRLAPLAFDASTLEIFAPLLAGGTIEVFPGRSVTPNGMASFLRDREITGLWLSAGLFRLVADFRPEGFRTVVQLLTGGDVVPPAQAADVLRACPGLRITNGYGPTENTTFTTVHHIDDPAAAATQALPIGRPLQGTGVLVLNPHGRLVPPGGIGELYTYGDGLAEGYTGMPEATAEVFGDFGRPDGRRLYRTGDLVRWDADGNLRFLGRRDRQVKIRGFRVEPDHIASVLRRHPDVRDAAVAIVPIGNGDQQILAAISTVGGLPLPDSIRAFAAANLPGYALPKLWAVADEFPVTANGKLDTRRLAELATWNHADPQTGPAPAEAPAPGRPGAGLEEAIAAAWQEVLGHRDFHHGDWFFDVGGDSLSLIRVHTVLGHALPEWEITIGDLYACSTISELAAKLRAEADERAASPTPANIRAHR